MELIAKPWKKLVFRFGKAKAAKELFSLIRGAVPPNLSFKKALVANYVPDVRA